MENTNNQSATARTQIIACHECDSLWSIHPLAPGQNLKCGCCGSRLRSRREHSMQKATALAFGAAAFFIVANLFPFMSMEVIGQSNEISLLRGVFALYREGDSWLGGTIAFFIIGAPFMMIAGILYLALPIMLGKVPPGGVRVCRLMIGSGSWNMAEVFLLGVLVSLLKLGHMAHVVLGLSFWAFIGLIICLAAAWSSLDRATIWDRLEEGADGISLKTGSLVSGGIDPNLLSDVAGGGGTPEALAEMMVEAVRTGLRATLKTGSLLTGQLFVDLDFFDVFDEGEPAVMAQQGEHPVIPTRSAGLARIEDKLMQVLDHIEKLQLGPVVDKTNVALASINTAVEDSRETIANLTKASAELEAILSDESTRKLPYEIKQTLAATRETLEGLNRDSVAYEEITIAIAELQKAARTVTTLADSIERQPNSLIFGTAGDEPKPPKGRSR